jgi:hypothetical protein
MFREKTENLGSQRPAAVGWLARKAGSRKLIGPRNAQTALPNMPPYRVALLFSACTAAAYLALCLFIQSSSGSWSADFVGYPDEPSHFVGAVMVRDWLVSGRWTTPFVFARTYYEHYPFFAIGYWPPLFSVAAGLWMLVAGVGRVQALFVPALFAAGTGWLIFHLVRRRMGAVAGLCAGALYLSLPEVRYWMSTVMVDHMTAFFCIASAVCLVRFLEDPTVRNGALYGVFCSCAILSKYSAAYLPVVPFAAILLLRRFDILKKPGFLVQPLVIALLVTPWVLLTKGLAFYGLFPPGGRPGMSVERAVSFVLVTFEIFPPILLWAVGLGVAIMLVRPKAWREDTVVLSLLFCAHLGFIFFSPIDPDERYVLAPAAAVLVTAFAGWSEPSMVMSVSRRWRVAASTVGIMLTAVLVLVHFRNSVYVGQDRIRDVVAFLANESPTAKRVIVPPTLEGPVIAEFVAQSRHRPKDYLLRPSKLLARTDWFDVSYSSTFANSMDMMEYFRQNPIDFLIWNERPKAKLKAHERIMSEMLQQYPQSWQRVFFVPRVGGSASLWAIYAYQSPPIKDRDWSQPRVQFLSR